MCGLACGDLCAALVQLSSWLFLALVIPLTCLYEVWCVEVVLSHCCRMTFFFYHDAPYPLLFGACLLILLSLLVFYLCSGSMFPLFCLFKGPCSLLLLLIFGPHVCWKIDKSKWKKYFSENSVWAVFCSFFILPLCCQNHQVFLDWSEVFKMPNSFLLIGSLRVNKSLKSGNQKTWFCCCHNLFCSNLGPVSDLVSCNIWPSQLYSVTHDMLKNGPTPLVGPRAHCSYGRLSVELGCLALSISWI